MRGEPANLGSSRDAILPGDTHPTSMANRSKPLPVGPIVQTLRDILQPAAVVPRLPLGGSEVSAADAPCQVGTASSRTRMRALLRKKARARRRSEASQREAADAGSVEGTSDAPASFEIFTARNRGDTTARSNNSSAYHIFTARRLEEGQDDEAESEWSNPETLDSNDDGISASSSDGIYDSAASGLIRGKQAWDHPLTQEEKKTRLLLLCEKEEALDDREIRRSQRLVEKLRGKLQSLRDDVVRLRQERNTWKTKANNLSDENRKLRAAQDGNETLAAAAILGGA
eukprot:gnl/TRDRNA2_/TRDRNA2_181068_c0_seq1.p1 gnl/TRDRNA2_/TRDRNA2_181068_c0~~gnl/TRDRNA2_/TRDRNA2_181068_c0_seq1.p1  ORF type:complete len:286 (-),score=56.05 gnl/TRDRNA2_/TRDRNA2_181068_c0_seq1:121-978(-)